MDNRVFILTVPSLLVLGALVAHSLWTLPRRRAIVFWSSVFAYGILRGVALRFVIDHGPGASFPYVIRNPLLPVFGVPLQEIAGWGIVTYIGWWIGSRFSRHVFVQISWACVFLGAISWTVESAAVAAGWWSWTVPVTDPLFVNVPFIAIVDWFFVGIDFLLPFAALTAPGLRRHPARFAALLAFPAHFGAHLFADRTLLRLPIPIHHLAHWMLLSILLWLALRSATEDVAFGAAGSGRDRAWPVLAGLSVVVIDAGAVELATAHRPALLLSILPTLAVTLQALQPVLGYAAGAAALVAGAWAAPCAMAAVPAAVALVFRWGGTGRRFVATAVVALLAVAAYQVHATGARRQAELMQRLAVAVSARDRGELEAAGRELAALAHDFPGSHVPPALLGEIDYRTGRLKEAREAFEQAVQIKQDYTKGYRYLAVIALRLGRKEDAASFAARGLEIDKRDLELAYLSARGRERNDVLDRVELPDPRTVDSLASLAFEVGDVAGAALVLDRGLALWPDQRSFYPARVKLALQGGDRQTARRIVDTWRTRFPQDAEARQLSGRLYD